MNIEEDILNEKESDFITHSASPMKKNMGLHHAGKDYFTEPMILGNDVWVGSAACITRNVRISDGAVIGADAVVTHDVVSYEIWAGVPAKKIGQRFSDEIIAELLELRWWDWPARLLAENIETFRDDEITLQKIHDLKIMVKLGAWM